MIKKIAIVTCIFASSLMSYAQEIPANSRITEVTVYRTLAKETRLASITIPKGNSDIVLSGISTLMTDNSLQVAVKGDATLLSAGVRTNYFNEENESPKDEKANRLRDTIKSIDTELGWITEQNSVANGEISLIDDNLKLSNPKEGFKPADLNALADIYRTRISELKRKLYDLGLKTETLRNRRGKFQSQLSEMGNVKKNPVKEIILSFSSETGASLQLTCSYLVSSAGWSPMYDIRVENTSKPVNLDYKAKLYQKTGNDWKDVKITVSTANPGVDNNRPLMSPKYIDYVSYAFKDVSSGGVTNMMQVDKVKKYTGDVDPTDYVVNVNESDIQVDFELELKQTIPSDGKEHICKLQRYTVPATYKYHAVPKMVPNAFLLARITDYGQYNLLAGAANIFFGDTYVGQVQLNPQITSDTLLISLGKDERIVVKRVKVESKLGRKLFNGLQKDAYAYELIIRNNKNAAIDIEILDQIPLSQRKEIEVELVDKSGAEYLPEFGKLLWNLTVKPNETKKVRLAYSIKYPEGKNVCER
jgi:uncharacterized protein (TIGR02231 family)